MNGKPLDGLAMIWIGIATIGLGVVVLNAWGTLRIWRSDLYERSQLVAQTILIWVVPGSAIAVVSLLDVIDDAIVATIRLPGIRKARTPMP